MSTTIRHAVFPVAGLGTRFLPATKAVPKELLPVVDRPLLQYAVEEAVAAGVTEIILISAPHKAVLTKHFSPDPDLEGLLSERGEDPLVDLVRATVADGVRMTTVIQEQALGLGHAVACARDLIGDAPFFVVLPDDLVVSQQPCLSQLAAHHARRGGAVVAVEKVAPSQTHRYGMVDVGEAEEGLYAVRGMIEKPEAAAAPSNLAVIGRYLLTAEIWPHLTAIEAGSGGEIQLTDAIAAMLNGAPVWACEFEGRRYDCGNPLGFLTACVDLALARADMGDALAEHLRAALNERGPTS